MIYVKLFYTFFKIGLFTIGGGYAMIPLIQSEILKNNWMKMDEIVNFIAVSESTPGPFAVNISTYVGAETAGILGAVCATLGVVLPSFIIIVIIARCYLAFKESKIVQGCMSGIRPTVVGLIATAVLSVGKTAFFPSGFAVKALIGFEFISAAIIFILMLMLEYKKCHPIMIIIASGILGIATGYLKLTIVG